MHKTNKIKAAFLLMVFSLNTIVSLACSVGFNFSKITNHHAVDKFHSHDKPHQHSSAKTHSHDHGDITGNHSHDENAVLPHDHSKNNTHETEAPVDENDCCSDEIVKLSLVDKAITKTNQNYIPLQTEVKYILSAFINSAYNNGEAFAKLKPPLLRSWDPASHTDLRIVIQSFQI